MRKISAHEQAFLEQLTTEGESREQRQDGTCGRKPEQWQGRDTGKNAGGAQPP
jgi:hypothetical protein